jgi:hypothetical protein
MTGGLLERYLKYLNEHFCIDCDDLNLFNIPIDEIIKKEVIKYKYDSKVTVIFKKEKSVTFYLMKDNGWKIYKVDGKCCVRFEDIQSYLK